MTARAGLPSTSGACAAAWSAARAREKSKVVAVIPSGSKTCTCMARSYAAPSSSPGKRTCPAVKPAAPAMGLEYWNSSPNLLVGSMVPSVARAPSGVRPPHSKIHSRSWRGIPVQAQGRCLTTPRRVVSASPRWKLGSRLMTGVSQVSRPWATSLASSSVVSALVFEAIMNSVSASTASLRPSSRTPKPPAKTTLPSCTMPSATPGRPSCLRPVSTKRWISASRASSRRCAVLPANDSRAYHLGEQAVEDQPHLGTALLAHRLRHVVDRDRPAATGVARRSLHVPALVGRRLVHVVPVLGPAEAVRLIVHHLERPLRLRLVRGPRRRDRRIGVLGHDVDQGNPRVVLRRLQAGPRPSNAPRPPRWGDEGVAGDRGQRGVGGEEPRSEGCRARRGRRRGSCAPGRRRNRLCRGGPLRGRSRGGRCD